MGYDDAHLSSTPQMRAYGAETPKIKKKCLQRSVLSPLFLIFLKRDLEITVLYANIFSCVPNPIHPQKNYA